MKNYNRASHAIVSELAAGELPDWIQLLPGKGRVDTRDGRGPYYNSHPETLLKAFAAFKMPLPGDYEHQSMSAGEKSGPVGASGWIDKMEIRGDGELWGNVKWTAQAADLISKREYRFISPVFDYNEKTGDIVQLVSFALTNNPNLFLRAAASQQGATMPSFIDKIKGEIGAETDDMSAYKKLKASMAAFASENPGCDEEEGGEEAPRAASPAPNPAPQDEMTAAATANSAHGNVVDMSKFVSMSMYNALAEKVAAAEQQKLDDILEAACIDGRIVGDGNRRAYASMAKADPEGFKKTIAGLPKVFAAHSTSAATQPTMTAEAMASSLTAEEVQMARAFQHTNLEFATMKLNHIKEAKDAAERGQAN